ncbi:unnamed protein product, partial [Effrenium voratum]
ASRSAQWELPERLQNEPKLRLDLSGLPLAMGDDSLALAMSGAEEVDLNLSRQSEEGLRVLFGQLPKGLRSLQIDLRDSPTSALTFLRGEDLQRLSLRLGFEAQRAPLALAQLPLQWLRLAAGTEQALQLPGSLKELELHLESPTEEFLLALPLLESLALFSPSVGAAALCAAAARATRRLRLRLGTAGEALAFAAVLPATLEELCLEVAEGDISSGAIALLAKHCPPNLAKLDLSIGELRIDSTQRLAEFCAEKEASAVPDAEAPDTDAGGVSQVQRTEAGGTWAV